MKGDEFDDRFSGPVPPHERQWRHPAEIADARRAEHLSRSTPPPLSRRTTTIVAAASLLASAALVVVAVPEGVEEWSTPPTGAVSKGSAGGRARHVVSSSVGEAGAVHLGDGYFVTSMEAVGDASDLSVGEAGGTQVDARVSVTDPAAGIVILSTDGAPPDAGSLGALPAAVIAEPGMVVVDPQDGSDIPCDPSFELTADVADGLDVVPIAPTRGFTGASLAYDQLGTVIGLVVTRDSTSLLLSRGAVEGLLSQARRGP